MSAAPEILRRIEAIGATLSKEGGQLVLRAGATPVPAGIIAALRKRKAELLAFVAPTRTRDSDDEETGDAAFDERAAIVEDGACVPREWAEGFARLDLARPLAGFQAERWRRLIDDGGRFLDRWAAVAVAAGWSATDVFGLLPAAPAARYDGIGLVALIDGGEVIAVETDYATIRMRSGNCLTYYLHRPRPDAVAAWELEATHDRRLAD